MIKIMHFKQSTRKGITTMNSNITTQAKPAKKLMINKETIRQLASTQLWTGTFGPTADCSLAGTCTTCAC
jgi:hypothetical protein